jgi:hypothetical protein
MACFSPKAVPLTLLPIITLGGQDRRLSKEPRESQGWHCPRLLLGNHHFLELDGTISDKNHSCSGSSQLFCYGVLDPKGAGSFLLTFSSHQVQENCFESI